MSATAVAQPRSVAAATHVDVLIVGAGISGIGSAWHMHDQCPGKTYAVLEAKDTFGGTWDTHKYPGVRSDSDLYTFGYRFKPWVGAPDRGIMEGDLRDGGSLETRGANVAYWHQWPDEYDYLMQKWDEFLSA